MLLLLLFQFTSVSQDPGGSWFEVQHLHGTHISARLGWDVTLVGDTNQDGCAEYLLGSPRQDVNGVLSVGAIYLFDGATGGMLREHQGTDIVSQFGWVVCVIGDVNQDGIPEYGASASGADPGQIGARIFDGATGSLLHALSVPANSRAYGNAMDGVGDWNLDGIPDYAVADYFIDLSGGRFTAGIIYVHSGVDGALLQSLEGNSSGHQYGKGLRGQGDVDGDGIQDLAVWSAWRGSAVHILKGGTGAEIYRLDSLTGNGYFGSGLDFIDDVDQDGCDDILIGAPQAGSFDHGEAYLFSGRTGTMIYRWYGHAGRLSDFGDEVASIGDMDRDGIEDIAIGDPDRTGLVRFFSGADGRQVHYIAQADNYQLGELGKAIAGGMDVNGDGLLDVVLTDDAAGGNGHTHVGAAMVFSFDPYLDASDRLLSASSGGNLAFALDFPAAEAGHDYRLLASTNVLGNQGPGTKPWMTLSGVTIPLVETALTHRMLNRPPAAFAGAQGTLDANGSATVTLTLPPGAAASEVGRTFRFAAVSIQANGHASASSAAVLLTISP